MTCTVFPAPPGVAEVAPDLATWAAILEGEANGDAAALGMIAESLYASLGTALAEISRFRTHLVTQMRPGYHPAW